MFIAIVGSRFSGKSSVEEYLISKGFVLVRLLDPSGHVREHSQRPRAASIARYLSPVDPNKHASFLSMTPLASPTTTSMYSPIIDGPQPIYFFNTLEMLNYVTENWRKHFVTSDLSTRDLLQTFVRRPFFIILQTDAPVLERYGRCQRTAADMSLLDFLEDNDRIVYGTKSTDQQESDTSNSLQSLSELVNIRIINSFPSMAELHKYLDQLNLLDSEHLRPSWDSYFMTLASLASRRSNCMKRRVGAVLVRGNHVLATGYNGTPRGLKNCRDGGCPHCNYTSKSNLISNECLCLHAEENALLEAGRDRVGADCVLYCNTCPCLKCTIKIIQIGVKTVVYNLAYKVDDASSRLFKEAGVELRRFDPQSKIHLLPTEDHPSALGMTQVDAIK